MALTDFPNGITSFGVPVIGGATIPSTTGKYWFVSSVKGSDGNYGSEVNKPKATLSSALAASLAISGANTGDVIVLMPGHAETVTAPYAINVQGVNIVGLGYGGSRPTFTSGTNTTAVITITGASTVFQNVRFVNGVDQQAEMVYVQASDVQFLGCEFVLQTTSTSTITGIYAGTTAVAARMVVDTCNFEGIAAGTTMTAAIDIENAGDVDYYIRNNYFTGKATQLIQNATTVLRGTITNNEFVVYTGTKGINMGAASTPFVVNNRFNLPSGTQAVVAAAGFVAGNVLSNAAGNSATASTF